MLEGVDLGRPRLVFLTGLSVDLIGDVALLVGFLGDLGVFAGETCDLPATVFDPAGVGLLPLCEFLVAGLGDLDGEGGVLSGVFLETFVADFPGCLPLVCKGLDFFPERGLLLLGVTCLPVFLVAAGFFPEVDVAFLDGEVFTGETDRFLTGDDLGDGDGLGVLFCFAFVLFVGVGDGDGDCFLLPLVDLSGGDGDDNDGFFFADFLGLGVGVLFLAWSAFWLF